MQFYDGSILYTTHETLAYVKNISSSKPSHTPHRPDEIVLPPYPMLQPDLSSQDDLPSPPHDLLRPPPQQPLPDTTQTNMSVQHKNITKTPTENSSKQTHPHKPHQSRTPRNVYKTALISDSQMNHYTENKFSDTFPMRNFKAGSYKELESTYMRYALALPNVQCYVIQLGVNDLRHLKSAGHNEHQKAVELATNCITKLLECSSAKIIISLPTPTPGPANHILNENINAFNTQLNKWISSTRAHELSNTKRLFTVNNYNFDNSVSNNDNRPSLFNHDMLHVSNYGLKKLLLNIKFGLYRAFEMNYTYKPNKVIE